jgi:hypothetical protein
LIATELVVEIFEGGSYIITMPLAMALIQIEVNDIERHLKSREATDTAHIYIKINSSSPLSKCCRKDF